MIMDFLFSDKLGSTVFAPVKMDFVGNIKVRVADVRFHCSTKEMITYSCSSEVVLNLLLNIVTSRISQH